MENISTPLEVVETCSALSRPRAAAQLSGVVNADITAMYQGTGLPFAGRGDVLGGVTRHPVKGDPSGTTAWSPPV